MASMAMTSLLLSDNALDIHAVAKKLIFQQLNWLLSMMQAVQELLPCMAMHHKVWYTCKGCHSCSSWSLPMPDQQNQS